MPVCNEFHITKSEIQANFKFEMPGRIISKSQSCWHGSFLFGVRAVQSSVHARRDAARRFSGRGIWDLGFKEASSFLPEGSVPR